MDVGIIFKIAAVGILTAVVNQVLKKADKDEIATLMTLAGLVIVLLMVMAEMVAMRIRKIKRGRSVGFRKYNPEHEAGKNKGVQNCISFFY